jgi:hypothetical protein
VNDTHPWWLWPNVLGLDAPLVAVVWQLFLATVAGVAVPLAASAVLALVVWGVYLADRGLDAHRGAADTDRHRAAGRYRTVWLGLAAAALLAAATLAVTALPQAYLTAGCAVGAFTLGYFAAVHLIRTQIGRARGVKEVSVGVLFAAGVSVPLVAEARAAAGWLWGTLAFAALCWLNCTLISVWEDGAEAGPPAWLAPTAGVVAVAAGLGAPRSVAVAVCASAAALAALHTLRLRVSSRVVRVLADVVLLTPLFVWGSL